MKKFVYLCLIVMFSCSREHSVQRTYLIENKTDYKIRIEFFQGATYVRAVDLKERNSSWQIYYEEDLAGGVDAFKALGTDSIRITFDDTKVQYYTIGNSSRNRNLLFNHAYSIEKKLYRFSFVDEDYENAEDL